MIYLDNAATSCPKPPEVVAAVAQALQDVCANPSRGAYELSLEASRGLLRTRRASARVVGIRDEARVIFTLNATRALNIALKGLLGLKTTDCADAPGTDWSPPVAPIVSLAVDGLASAEVARVLDKEFDIAVRAGLHCAPGAHRVAGTLEGGLVRLSIGHTTTEAEVAEAVAELLDIAGRPARHWLTEWEGQHAQ